MQSGTSVLTGEPGLLAESRFAAPEIATAVEALDQNQGGNPGDVAVLVVAALESLVLPAAGPGTTGLTPDQIAALISQIVNPTAGGPGNFNGNSYPSYEFGMWLPPASAHL